MAVVSVRKVDSPFGKYEMVVRVLQRQNESLTLESCPKVVGEWTKLHGWGPSPVTQWANLKFHTDNTNNFVRATTVKHSPSTNAPGSPVAIISSVESDGFKAWREPITRRTQ